RARVVRDLLHALDLLEARLDHVQRLAAVDALQRQHDGLDPGGLRGGVGKGNGDQGEKKEGHEDSHASALSMWMAKWGSGRLQVSGSRPLSPVGAGAHAALVPGRGLGCGAVATRSSAAGPRRTIFAAWLST